LNILVLNAGSSSLKYSVFASGAEPVLLLDKELSPLKPSIEDTIAQIIIDLSGTVIHAVGYRVVHPGPNIQTHVRITEDVLKELEHSVSYAPLHDPEAIAMIRATMAKLPDIPHFACFDTVFHQTMPEEASTYPIPESYRSQGLKRYGFHGLSCESIVRQLRLAGPIPARTVIAHLGSGCSVTALLNGESIDTTMGLTPTGGVVMGTRPGDLDPGLVLYLLRQQQGRDAASQLEKMLNHDAGVVALSRLPNDMKQVRKASAGYNDEATLALKVFTRSVKKAIGGFAWLLGGLDAIVFTGGIGEHDAATRVEILANSEAQINSALNEQKIEGLTQISASESVTAVYASPAQEDLVIALHVERMMQPA
jgi:acetate kinase